MARFRFPFRFGSVPASAPSASTAVTPSRWAGLSGAAATWSAPAVNQSPRFEAVKWASGRQQWNNSPLGGQLNFVVSSEAGFLIASDGVAVIASDSTVNS